MLWKILSALSAICLAVGLWFSYQNKGAYDEERRLEDRSKQNLKAVMADQLKKTEAKEKRTNELKEYVTQRDDRRMEVKKVNSDIAEKEKETEGLKKTLEEAQKQLTTIREQIAKAGDLKKLIAEIEDLNKQVKDSEAAIANQEQQKAIIEEKLASTNVQVKKLQEVDARQRRGQIEPGLTARVTQAYQGYGFVVLNKGNGAGVYANNLMDVKRGNSTIARLKVRDVESGQSVADVVPGSLAPGESVQPGDLAVAAARAPDPIVPVTPKAPTTLPAGGAPPAMGADLFGGAAPPAIAPEPTPAPAPGAGAPPAGEKPSTADPFAPAPQ